MALRPLPFRISSAGYDHAGLGGIESVSYRITGLLHLTDESVNLEWTQTETVERVSFERVGTDVEQLSPEWLELPWGRIDSAWVAGWLWPRLEIRVREPADFEGVPGARGVTLPLKIERRDRALAREVVRQIAAST